MRALAVVSVVAVLAAGCGSSVRNASVAAQPATAASQWVQTVCSAEGAWIRTTRAMASAAAEKLNRVSDPAERQQLTTGMITTIAGRTQQLAAELEAAGAPDVVGGAQIANELAASAAADAQGYREYATLYAALDAVDLDAGSRRIEATMKPKAQAAYEQATAALKRDPTIATLTAQNTGCQAAFNAVD